MLTGSSAVSQYPRMVQCRLGQLLRHNTHVWRNGNWINCCCTMLTRSQHLGMMQWQRNSVNRLHKRWKNRPICGYIKLGSSSKSQNENNGKLHANGSPHRGTSWWNDDLNPQRTSFLIIEACQRDTKRVLQYFRLWWLHISRQRSLSKCSNSLQKRWAEIEPWTADKNC